MGDPQLQNHAVKYLWLLALIALSSSGCAVLGEDHRYVAKALDENLSPESTAAKVALAPVAVPVGFAALLIDGAVINPVCSVPEAFDDATYVFTDVRYTGIGEVVVFPMRVLTFTVMLIGSEAAHCALPID